MESALPPREGPLKGLKIVELAGIGPGPMCAMLLADMGASVIRIQRPNRPTQAHSRAARFNLLNRSRQTIEVDLKSNAGRELVLKLVEGADGLIEGFRPGVTERLGLGPTDCLDRNPALVYGRVTGWGQDGPIAQSAGHDINFIALTGLLDAIGPAGAPPAVPLNVVGDFGGGALYLAMGMLAAMIEARGSGLGQVVDAAIVDGVASLSTLFYGMIGSRDHRAERGTNLLDGGAYYYGVYRCADDKLIAIGAMERQFHDRLLMLLGLDSISFPRQEERDRWPEARAQLATSFASRDRTHWLDIFSGEDVCVSPVLSFTDAVNHPHLKARQTYMEIDGITQPAPAPRFSRTPTARPHAPCRSDIPDALRGWLAPQAIAAFEAQSRPDKS